MAGVVPRNAYSRVRVQKAFTRPSRTKQSFRDSVNVNVIVKKWQTTQHVEHMTRATPLYGDFSNVGDYQSCLERVQAVERNFRMLPAAARDRVGNDPARFLAFAIDPGNRAELDSLGLKGLAERLHGPLPVPPPPEPPVLPSEPAPAG